MILDQQKIYQKLEDKLKLKVINQNLLKDWAKEIFKDNSFHMVDISSKKATFRRALASGKIFVGEEVFNLIKNNK